MHFEWTGAQEFELVEAPGQTPYLKYYEDVSKNNPGGLKHRKVQSKSVVHYANSDVVLFVSISSIVQSVQSIDQKMPSI